VAIAARSANLAESVRGPATIKTILLVEDDASEAQLARLAFARCGVPCTVAIARDGADALDYVFATGIHAGRAASARPAVVVLDLQLPRVSGFEVLERIRSDATTRLLPVVVFTRSREDRDLRTCYELGANAYLHKSVDFAGFAETARTLGAFWLGLNELAPSLRGG
jgi:two-component system response regulator